MVLLLYEQDYYLWLQKTAQLLRDGLFHEIDIPNLVDEIEDMGRSEKRAIESNLRVVLMHLLKYKYQPNQLSNSWLSTIREHRLRLQKQIKDSPSLKPYLETVFDECYADARELAADETGLRIETLPLLSPFAVSEALNRDYLPE